MGGKRRNKPAGWLMWLCKKKKMSFGVSSSGLLFPMSHLHDSLWRRRFRRRHHRGVPDGTARGQDGQGAPGEAIVVPSPSFLVCNASLPGGQHVVKWVPTDAGPGEEDQARGRR